jgi:excisionase family DNA binding protein
MDRCEDQEDSVEEKFVTMKEAQEILNVSNYTMWKMVKDGRIKAYQSEVDRRRKLIRRSDLDGIMQARPIEEFQDPKIAA